MTMRSWDSDRKISQEDESGFLERGVVQENFTACDGEHFSGGGREAAGARSP